MGGGGKSGGGSSTVEQKSDPWEGQQPYLNKLFSEASRLYNSGGLSPDYYSGSTIAGMDPATEKALQLQEQRALAGNTGMNAAQGQLADTMSGKYLENNPFMNSGGNPQLDAMVQRAIGQAGAGVNSGFAGAGRYGSGAHAAAAQDSAGNIATQMYGQAYDADQNRALSAWNTERENQMRGMMFAPQLAQADYSDLAALSEVGTARENYDQNKINADVDRYNYGASQPLNALQNYANLIQGNYGMSGSSTSSNNSRSNPLGGVLSGAAAGGGLATMLGASNPWIAGAAGLGGLLGLF